MKNKKTFLLCIVILVLAVGVGSFFAISKHIENKNIESAVLKLCDYMDACNDDIQFTNGEYKALSKVSKYNVSSLEDAMKTQPLRVAVLEKCSSLLAEDNYEQILDLIWYLGQNHFSFSTSGNDFDILFSDSDLEQISEYVKKNSSGSEKVGYATAYTYNGKKIIFDYHTDLFGGIQDDSAEIFFVSIASDYSLGQDSLRSSRSIHVGEEFCEENLTFLSMSIHDEKPTFSDYLKENAPDLYNSIKQRYESISK